MQTAFRLLKENLGDPETAGARFEFNRYARGKGSAGGLEHFQLLTFGRMPVEKRAGGGVEGCGFAGFVGRREDVETGREGPEANSVAEAAHMREFEGVEDHGATSLKV